MITEKRLAELKRDFTVVPMQSNEAENVIETLSLAWKVIRAAQAMRERAILMCVYPSKPSDPPALYDLRELEKALAPFDEKEKPT